MMIDLDGNEVKVQPVEEVHKRKRIDLFTWLNNLGFDKTYILDEETEKDFDVFMIRRGLSQNAETIMFANELNKHWQIPKEMVYDFFHFIIPKRKRYGKWAKQNNDEKDTLDLIIKHYNVNRIRAQEYLKLLTQDEIEQIKQNYDVGGK